MHEHLRRLRSWLESIDRVRVACSGGIDSTLLAHVAHDVLGGRAAVVHAVSPAVPPEATERVLDQGRLHGWSVMVVRGGEFEDERYLANPVDRCYHCKSHLYAALARLSQEDAGESARFVTVSGANVDDLGEYRPGLEAARESGVRHPYVELAIAKRDIRDIARGLRLPYAELPASPCLASRLYTGTRVTPERLRFVHQAETIVRESTGCSVVRCRIEGARARIEVPDADRARIDERVLHAVREAARQLLPEITDVVLDDRAYAPGRAFVGAPA